MKVSFVITVYNEEQTINDLLSSIFIQSRIPDEIVIVDGGSTDRTASLISNFIHSASRRYPEGHSGQISNKQIKFKFIIKKSNRSVGRNEAIKKSSNEIIVCSDAGCTLDKDWVKNIIKPFEDQKTEVVAGYYEGYSKGIFQKCLIPYVLVMPDRVDKNNFLPSTRSIAFKKYVWKKVGGFPQEFNDNEDYVFAKKLKVINANIVFKKSAIVYWSPRDNLKDAFIMFYRFAKGDVQAHIFRPKVILMFVRYAIGVVFIISFLIFKSYIMLNTLYLMLLIYIVWAITKNYKYVKDFRAIFILPLIQFVSDIAVITGTSIGLLIK